MIGISQKMLWAETTRKFLIGGLLMKKIYTDMQALVADGFVKEEDGVQCVQVMQQEFIEYVVGGSLTCAYPVLEMYSNPRKAMQGGFIAAAFDNTFGALVYFTTKRLDMATIDMDVNYHKPIYENDELTVKVEIKSLGKSIVHLLGEAYDGQKNLVATATTNIYLLNSQKSQ